MWPPAHRHYFAHGDLTELTQLHNLDIVSAGALNLQSSNTDHHQSVPRVDIVSCFEVAEHLPQRYASAMVHLLVAQRPSVIFFSAATPGQEGIHHVNCQVSDQSQRQWRQ